MIEGKGLISIWFFIGVLLLAYGVLILASGIYNVYVPPAHPVVFAKLHAAVWWGVFLALLGGFYTFRFFPNSAKDAGRKTASSGGGSTPGPGSVLRESTERGSNGKK
jgi:hypothetical protein